MEEARSGERSSEVMAAQSFLALATKHTTAAGISQRRLHGEWNWVFMPASNAADRHGVMQ